MHQRFDLNEFDLLGFFLEVERLANWLSDSRTLRLLQPEDTSAV